MTNKINVLDHGYVILRNIAGPTRRTDQAFDANDVDVANAARMSFDGADLERTYEVEMKLNRYLAVNRHMSPFEMIEVWLQMKLPIFVARQLVRHRTAGLNEVSGRYVQLPGEWYIPALESVELATPSKKQGGKCIDMLNEEEVAKAVRYQRRLGDDCQRSYLAYQEAIADGIAMEQARLHLHVNHYTEWLFKQDLRNLFHLLSLRQHGHAQQEVRWYADAVVELIEPYVPGLVELYKEVMR